MRVVPHALLLLLTTLAPLAAAAPEWPEECVHGADVVHACTYKYRSDSCVQAWLSRQAPLAVCLPVNV